MVAFGRDTLTLDFERLADGAQLIAIAGANGRGKTTVMDNMHPYLSMPSREAGAGPGGFSYYDHVCLPESEKDLTWAHEGRSYRSQVVIRLNGRRKTEAFLFVLAGMSRPAWMQNTAASRPTGFGWTVRQGGSSLPWQRFGRRSRRWRQASPGTSPWRQSATSRRPPRNAVRSCMRSAS